jgi:L-aminopeptidase/D-esterase-like protein
MRNALTDVSGIAVGHWTDLEAGTGCTVILTPQGVTASLDVRGSSPGTRETDLLQPQSNVDRVHAIVLSGGSAFGLAAADGVMRWLDERGYGWQTPAARVPIVPGAILFDLAVGDAGVRPTAENAYAACEAANLQDDQRGNIGVGAGCTVGKLLGLARASRGGLGQASVHLPGGVVVSALIAVNALGDVVDPWSGTIIAGARTDDGDQLADALTVIQSQADRFMFRQPPSEGNTTIGVIATNARLNKIQCQKLAQMGHDGLGRTTRPAHTMYDGDCLFVLATGENDQAIDLSLLGAVASDVVAQAILDAVRAAQPGYGLPAASQLEPIPLTFHPNPGA